MIKELTDETFQHVLDNSELPVLVVWRANWCAPSRQINPTLNQLDKLFDEQIIMYKIDINENPKMAEKMGVRGIPTLYLFKGGQVHAKKSGSLPLYFLKEWLEVNL